MGRFSLRTLTLLVLIAPPLTAGLWTYWQRRKDADQKKPVAIDLRLPGNTKADEQVFSFYLGMSR